MIPAFSSSDARHSNGVSSFKSTANVSKLIDDFRWYFVTSLVVSDASKDACDASIDVLAKMLIVSNPVNGVLIVPLTSRSETSKWTS